MNQGPNWIHLVALLIIVGFSVISWIYRQLNEQAAKKRQRDMIEERRREMLRTGRDPGESHAPMEMSGEAQRQREIAARREAQLAELRRRAQARQSTEVRTPPVTHPPIAPPTMAPPPLTRIPGSTGPTVPQRRTTMGPAPRPAPRPAPPVAAARPKPKKPAARPQPMVRAAEEETTHRLVADEPVQARRPSPIVTAAPQTPEEWRKAIIANEILARPLSERQHEVQVPF